MFFFFAKFFNYPLLQSLYEHHSLIFMDKSLTLIPQKDKIMVQPGTKLAAWSSRPVFGPARQSKSRPACSKLAPEPVRNELKTKN